MTVEVRQAPIGGNLKEFLNVVDYIYRDDPNYVRPLDMMVKDQLSKKNPFFQHGEGTTFTAHRNGWCVGRCTAQIDRLHLDKYKDDVGFFGFFDTTDDEEVAKALIEAARQWLRSRGMKHIRGPLSLSINEEAGCLIDGFDTPPMFLMAHHRAYQAGLIEKAGLQKEKDLYAWRYQVGEISERARKATQEIEKLPEVSARHIDPKNLERDVRMIMDIFNDAWSDNWGFVPLTESEIQKMSNDFKLILDPAITYIAYVDGEPAAVSLALPNLNEVIGDLGGKVLPLGLPKLLYRLKVRGTKSARLIILGIKKKYRHVRKYAGLSIYLYSRMNEAGKREGYRWGELSWTLEDNGPVNVGIKFMGGKLYKKYRLYQAAL
jgi:hypothetical protein